MGRIVGRRKLWTVNVAVTAKIMVFGYGGQPDFRTSKHNGTLYKLLAVGDYSDILNIQQKELEKYGLYSCERSYFTLASFQFK